MAPMRLSAAKGQQGKCRDQRRRERNAFPVHVRLPGVSR
jgi:hypothetical protein